METDNGAASPVNEALLALQQDTGAGGPAPGASAPAEKINATEVEQLKKVSAFLTGKIAKLGNRALPGLFADKDERELADLLNPVLVKHIDKLGAWFEKWFEEIMLGVFVVDKAMDAVDLIRARRAAPPKKTDEQPAT